MAKLKKKIKERENEMANAALNLSVHAKPAKVIPAGMYPFYLLPDLDPMQKQMNRIESSVLHEARCRRSRAWKKAI